MLALIRNGANAPAFSDARPPRFAETSLRRRHRDRVVRRGLGMMIESDFYATQAGREHFKNQLQSIRYCVQEVRRSNMPPTLRPRARSYTSHGPWSFLWRHWKNNLDWNNPTVVSTYRELREISSVRGDANLRFQVCRGHNNKNAAYTSPA